MFLECQKEFEGRYDKGLLYEKVNYFNFKFPSNNTNSTHSLICNPLCTHLSLFLFPSFPYFTSFFSFPFPSLLFSPLLSLNLHYLTLHQLTSPQLTLTLFTTHHFFSLLLSKAVITSSHFSSPEFYLFKDVHHRHRNIFLKEML